MYGFEPALVFTGEPKLEQLRKVKAVEHLLILAQLGERQVMQDIGLEVERLQCEGLIPLEPKNGS